MRAEARAASASPTRAKADAGLCVQVEDGRGALLGEPDHRRRDKRHYVRRPDDDQTWAVREGETHLPPLRDVAAWL